MPFVENIFFDEELLAIVVYGSELPEKTTFVTPEEKEFQVGFIARNKEERIDRHFHRANTRTICNTAEVLLVMKGEIEIDIYSGYAQHIGKWRLNQGNVIVLLSGGHGLYFHDDTVLLEIKQGPYISCDEKIVF